jgi:hypothetical protein
MYVDDHTDRHPIPVLLQSSTPSWNPAGGLSRTSPPHAPPLQPARRGPTPGTGGPPTRRLTAAEGTGPGRAWGGLPWPPMTPEMDMWFEVPIPRERFLLFTRHTALLSPSPPQTSSKPPATGVGKHRWGGSESRSPGQLHVKTTPHTRGDKACSKHVDMAQSMEERRQR